MSTISSNINSVATAYSVDFYQRFRPTASNAATLRVARRTCIVSGALGMCMALLMATWHILSLLDFFQEILGLLSSGLGGLFLMGIFFPRIGGKAALTGFVCGVGAVFAVRYLTTRVFCSTAASAWPHRWLLACCALALSGSTNHSTDCAG